MSTQCKSINVSISDFVALQRLMNTILPNEIVFLRFNYHIVLWNFMQNR